MEKLKKETFRIQQELWNFLKKYIDSASDNHTDAYWDAIRDDCTKIYNSTEDMPEYFREMTSKMIVAAADLLEGIYREEHKHESKR